MINPIMNNKANLKIPKITPTPSTFQTEVFGKGIKKTAGIATIVNLNAENKIGGNSSKPSLIIGKFIPQIRATKRAKNIFFEFKENLYI